MKIFNMYRGAGKTTEILKFSAENRVPILVRRWYEVDTMKQKAKDIGLDIPDPVYVLNVSESLAGKQIVIDDADSVWSGLINLNDLIATEELYGARVVAISIGKKLRLTKRMIAEKFGLTVSDLILED